MRFERIGAAVALVAASMLLSCSAPEDDGVATASGATAGPSASQAEPDSDEQMRAYQQCLKENGVALAEPGAPPSTTDADTLKAAFAACLSLMPGSDELARETVEQFEVRLNTARCMRAGGYPQWPDPVPGSATLAIPREIDASSPEVTAAYNTCARKSQSAASPSPA